VEQRIDLVVDPVRGDKVPITLPLSFRVPLDQVRSELGVSEAVDFGDPIVAKAAALAAAARRSNPSVRLAFFGGTAHRLSCPSSNDPTLGLRHELHDLDVAVLVKEVRAFGRFLTGLAGREGSGLTFFETSGDRIYNSLSGGQRLRWHMVTEQRATEIVLGTLDIVADEFQFCHRFDVRADVEGAPSNGWTLTPTHLLLAKGQFIQRIDRAQAAQVPERVLEPFGKQQVIIGPEAKDVRDLLALLHDHAVGEGVNEVSPEQLGHLLEADWGLWKTLGLNLAMVARSPILAGLVPGTRARIGERLEKLRQSVAAVHPKRRFGFLGGPWWQEVDSTPSVDSSVRVPSAD
jgi:hypothetical protein